MNIFPEASLVISSESFVNWIFGLIYQIILIFLFAYSSIFYTYVIDNWYMYHISTAIWLPLCACEATTLLLHDVADYWIYAFSVIRGL